MAASVPIAAPSGDFTGTMAQAAASRRSSGRPVTSGCVAVSGMTSGARDAVTKGFRPRRSRRSSSSTFSVPQTLLT